jgi:hypothetical protein
VNLVTTLRNGSEVYVEAEKSLKLAIDEYDQAVIDLTLSILAGMYPVVMQLELSDVNLFVGMQTSQRQSQGARQDEEFFDWPPSYWPVEAQLGAARKQRDKSTLQWIPNMPEFKAWQPNGNELDSSQQTLWIKGHPGTGKSTIAGYLIDFLQCMYPHSIVLYFFCKKDRPGLTSAIDIIRTLAYQIVRDIELRSALDDLRRSGFPIDRGLGVSLLFDKLVEGPLEHCNKDIFIVVDGIDEADETMDNVERKAEMDVLLERLATLPSARTLFLSRPPSDITRVVPNATTKTITIGDSRQDIEIYVKNIVESSTMLQALFRENNIDPVQYFAVNSNGVFLWVTSVFKELLYEKTVSRRQQYLDDFSQLPGDIDQIYLGVLLNVPKEEKKWVMKTLCWVLMARYGPANSN